MSPTPDVPQETGRMTGRDMAALIDELQTKVTELEARITELETIQRGTP